MPFGATRGGVERLVLRAFTATTRPTDAQVDALLLEEGEALEASWGRAIAALPDDDPDRLRTRVTTLARLVTHYAVAAQAEASAMPELADPNDATAFASWLWRRYEAARTELLELLDDLTPGDVDDVPAAGPGATSAPAWNFPPSGRWGSRGW